MYTIRNFILAVIATLVVASFSKIIGIPVTILDLILFPILICAIFVVIRELLTRKKPSKKDHRKFPPPPPLKCILMIVVFLFMAGLGGWSTWMGMLEPLTLFSGVRGCVYGYTMIPLGIFLMGIAIYGTLFSMKTLIHHLRGNN